MRPRGTATADARWGRFSPFVDGPLLVLLLTIPSWAGCSQSPPGQSVTRSDSAEVRIVETHSPRWDSVRPLDHEMLLSVPPRVDPETAVFSRVSDGDFLPGGGVAILDGQLQRVLLFDSAGAQVASFGGRGQGPGEFSGAVSLNTLADGTVRVYDARLGRFTEFTSQGEMTAALTLTRKLFPRPPNRAWLLDGTRVLAWEYNLASRTMAGRSGAKARAVVPGILRVVDLSTGAADTLLEAPGREMIDDGGRIWVAPFGAQAKMVFDGASLFFASGLTHSVSVVDPSVGQTHLFRYPEADAPISDRELASLASVARREAADAPGALEVAFLFDRELQPSLQPAFQAVQVSDSGEIWAQEFLPFGDSSGVWWIISPDGRFAGRVRLPAKAGDILALSEGRLLLRALDAFDVPSVQIISVAVDDGGAGSG